jgi:hypothetical protein
MEGIMDTALSGQHRTRFMVAAVLMVIILAALMAALMPRMVEAEAGKAKGRRSGEIKMEVRNASAGAQVIVPAAAGPGGFSPSVRMGFTVGDQWEPAIAADRFGHVYILYPQYFGVPGCADCPSPTMVLMISSDHGATFSAPQPFQPTGGDGQQWDPQIEVDSVDGRTVYASWMENGKSDIMVGKSTDFGQTWTPVLADHVNAAADKPILTVRGQDVYVAYNHSNSIWFASSHDGGQTFTKASKRTGNLGWSLPAGGFVASNGTAYFSWNGYEKSGSTTGDVNLYLTRSTDGGKTWSYITIGKSGAPPQCPDYSCGWAYLGAQIVMTGDAANNLYVLWNGNSVDGEPNRMYFQRSTNGGSSWSAKSDVSAAGQGIHHNFPAIVAGANGEVRISWQDGRGSHSGTPAWNTYYRSSTNGGQSWTSEVDISTFVTGLETYIWAEGYRFPFGDYYEMAIDEQGTTHVVWGQGFSYDSPGSIWYSKGK